jgi:hypothetical protein
MLTHLQDAHMAQQLKLVEIAGSRENVQGYFRRLPSISVFGFNKSKHAETGS